MVTPKGSQLLGRQMRLTNGKIEQYAPYMEGSRPDILARSDDGHLVVIEVKGPSQTHKNGVRQVREYLQEAQQVTGKAAGYVVAPGFPRRVRDEAIGLVGYVIEDGGLYLIPWRDGPFTE